MKPFAVTAADSRGREHQDSYLSDEDPFVIDRRRILYSSAFRRLRIFVGPRLDSEVVLSRARFDYRTVIHQILQRLGMVVSHAQPDQ